MPSAASMYGCWSSFPIKARSRADVRALNLLQLYLLRLITVHHHRSSFRSFRLAQTICGLLISSLRLEILLHIPLGCLRMNYERQCTMRGIETTSALVALFLQVPDRREPKSEADKIYYIYSAIPMLCANIQGGCLMN